METALRPSEHAAADTGRAVRVAQVVGRWETGGVKSTVMNYYRAIDRSKIQFDFIVESGGEVPRDEEVEKLGGRFFRVTPYVENLPRSMAEYGELFRRNGYGIVHAHLNTLSVFPLMAAKAAGVPVRIAHNHTSAAGFGPKSLLKYATRPLSGVCLTHRFACSASAGSWMFGRKRVAENGVLIFPNAFSRRKFTFDAAEREAERARLGLGDAFAVGSAGRLVPVKNHRFMLEIFREIHQANENSVLLIAGDGPLRGALEQKAESLGLGASVRFLGDCRDIPGLLQAMDAFLFPSLYEGYGLALAEAQAAGLPCFASLGAVPAEADISGLVEFLPLARPAREWALTVLRSSHLGRRSPSFLPGMEIEAEAKKLEGVYLRLAAEADRIRQTAPAGRKGQK